MKINKTETAINLANNCSEHGAEVNELGWLYEKGFKGFENMTDTEIETYITYDCALNKESFPNIIVYEKEN